MTRSGPDAGIALMLMRGGTSRGVYVLADDLPGDPVERDDLVRRLIGAPHPLQVDGVGGAHPLTSKVAVISRSEHPDADVDYLFLQVAVDRPAISAGQPCGNILAGVGPFALERGLVSPRGETTDVRIRMVNSDGLVTAVVQTPHGRPTYAGTTTLSGVDAPAAPVTLRFHDLTGSIAPALLPTGNRTDEVCDVPVTCIDNGMPIVLLPAGELGLTGHETVEDLESDRALAERVERIRLTAGPMMGLGDVRTSTMPKMTIVAPPQHGGTIATRSFIPHRVHRSIGVFAATSVAAGVVLSGTVAEHGGLPEEGLVRVEHPSGHVDVRIDADDDRTRVHSSEMLRTARKIVDGIAWPVAAGPTTKGTP